MLGGEKGNFGFWHTVWLMVKLNKCTLLLEKIATKKFYVIRKFKRQGCLGEYKKETYLQDKISLQPSCSSTTCIRVSFECET